MLAVKTTSEGKTNQVSEWHLAGKSLDDLLISREDGDETTKSAIEEELFRRYRPCVYGKDNEIEMNPHYKNSNAWKVDTKQGQRYRACVTYEDPSSPNPEQSLDTDRFSTRFGEDEMSEAREIAHEKAEAKTAAWWEVYLSALTGKDVTLNRIITGIGPDGYPWNRIGFTENENPVVDEVKEEVTAILD